MSKKNKQKNRRKLSSNAHFNFILIIFNSIILSTVLVAILTFSILRAFNLESEMILFPLFFIGVPLLASAIVSLIFTILASRNSLKDLNNFLDAINKVSKGDFTVKLDSDKTKTLRPVYKSFNQMVKELNSIEMLRDDFISSFSHEFKTPIVSIKGFAKLAKSPIITEQERNDYLNIIISEINRLVTLSEDTLLLTNLESQEIVIEKEPFSLDEEIRRSIVLLQNDWENKNINLQLELENITFNGNSSLIQQLLINILNNSIKFTPKNGTISISLKEIENNSVLIKIKDDGIGMDEHTIKHIFDKFYQADSARASQGLGLGMSIAKRIVELCEGKIKIESKLNEGASFLITLPN